MTYGNCAFCPRSDVEVSSLRLHGRVWKQCAYCNNSISNEVFDDFQTWLRGLLHV